MPTKRKTNTDKSQNGDSFFDSFLKKEINLSNSFEKYKESKKPKLLPAGAQPNQIVKSTNSSAKPAPKNMPNTQKNNSAKPAKTSFFGSVWSVLNSDVVWSAIALGLMLGVVLFYIQGLQPLILSNYANTAQSKITEMNQSYAQQITQTNNFQARARQSFDYSLIQVCGEDQLYQTYETDLQDSERIKVGFLPRMEFSALESYRKFYDPQIQDIYKGVYQKYTTSLQNSGALFQEVSLWIPFLQYRNSWIEACQSIQNSTGQLSQLREICSTLLEETTNYKQRDTFPKFWGEVEKFVNAGSQDCQDIQSLSNNGVYSQFATWRLGWLDSFEDIVGVFPEIEENIQLLNSQVSDLSQSIAQARVGISNSVDQRRSLVGMWYLMRIEW